jgi:ketosteroid isomerase-like protein
MIPRRTPFLALPALVAIAACGEQKPVDAEAEGAAEMAAVAMDVAVADHAAVEQAMDEIEAAYIAAYNAGDAAGLADLWAADGTQAPPLSPVLDPAGIAETYAASFAAGVPQELKVMREDFVAVGGVAAAWGAFEVTATPPEGDLIVSSGRYGVVCRQEPDGTWKIYRHMFNYEVPPPGYGE